VSRDKGQERPQVCAPPSEIGQFADVQIGGELTGELGSRRRLVQKRIQTNPEPACFPVNKKGSRSAARKSG